MSQLAPGQMSEPQVHEASACSERVAALVQAMTLDQKLGQLNMPFTGDAPAGRDMRMPNSLEDIDRLVAGTFDDAIGPAGGFFMITALTQGSPAEQVARFNELQRAAQSAPLGIPLLQVVEGTHGVIASHATIFPEGLALGSTWDMGLLQAVYGAVAAEARALGLHMICTLVIEPNRDPRLGRNCEGYTEDPFLAAQIAGAILDGAQGDSLSSPDKVGVVFCHYPGQSQPDSGLERGAMHVSERDLRTVFLPPWERGAGRGGSAGVMATYAAFDGRPTHASQHILTEILRDEIGFDGIVFSEGFGFNTLLYEGVAVDQADAGRQALIAGVDVNITFENAYLSPLRAAVESGAIAESLIDRAVIRVLRIKERLGLLDGVATVDPERATAVVHNPRHAELARIAATDGIVVLRNRDGILPLAPSLPRIAVIGPNADNPVNQLGDYTIVALGGATPPTVTVLDGIRAVAEGAEIVYAKGCEVVGDDASGIAAAAGAAARSDVAIVVVGEQQGPQHVADAAKLSTVGEGADVASLDLTGLQLELVKAVKATGTPTIVVLINGRPLSTPWIDANANAVVEAWLPGEFGGLAIADILFGKAEPAGRLPITVPRHVGQLPVYYNHEVGKDFHSEIAQRYVDMPVSPLYEFGYGLSYTTFAYGALAATPRIEPNPGLDLSIAVSNTGNRPGVEVLQVYVRDRVASFTPKARELRGFTKLRLRPGESQVVEIPLQQHDFSMLSEDLQWVVEPGLFDVLVGSSSENIRCTAIIEADVVDGNLTFTVVEC